MENSLSTIVKADQSNWPKLVDACLFVYRTTYNRSLNEIPFFLLYGRDPRMPQDMFIAHDYRSNRSITAEDFDVYKSSLLHTLRSAYVKLSEHKQTSTMFKKTLRKKTF